MHLASFRKGWESERIAAFLLGRVAFLASPSTVSDDIGSDFYCTLFQTLKQAGHEYLQPRITIAVQVKSNGPTTIDLSDKADYLSQLDFPYFLGIVDRATTTLHLYSGCYLPHMFSAYGLQPILKAVLRSELQGTLPLPPKYPEGPPATPFPLLLSLAPDDNEAQLTTARTRLIEHSLAVASHLRSVRSNDYLLEYDSAEVVSVGPASARTFHRRLLLRLAEALANQNWLADKNEPVPATERDAIVALAMELRNRHALPLTLRSYLGWEASGPPA